MSTAKRPARIVKMARNVNRYVWRCRENTELAYVVRIHRSRRPYQYMITVEHFDGGMYHYPPREFWKRYQKIDTYLLD